MAFAAFLNTNRIHTQGWQIAGSKHFIHGEGGKMKNGWLFSLLKSQMKFTLPWTTTKVFKGGEFKLCHVFPAFFITKLLFQRKVKEWNLQVFNEFWILICLGDFFIQETFLLKLFLGKIEFGYSWLNFLSFVAFISM